MPEHANESTDIQAKFPGFVNLFFAIVIPFLALTFTN